MVHLENLILGLMRGYFLDTLHGARLTSATIFD